VVLPSGQKLHYTIPFLSSSACAQELPSNLDKSVNELC
jgi:hypothetical protein